ncbi:unnamed protein product [Owenia fusiformis]|uniref:Uncharacterized protein n=1 Tax=Owenia fusiformis TaxID=6347 RepID=A0A8J1TCH0_OWEFU|nr:unnamed protein product [Owenia fusiformis]
MSIYEDYEKRAAVYDKHRVAAGVDTLIGIFLGQTRKPLSQQMRDKYANCGTVDMPDIAYVYEKRAAVYDKHRVAAGVDTLIGILLGQTRKPLSQLHVLDAGCGTGNYSLALLKEGLGHVTLLDASEGMLHVAKKKLQTFIKDDKAVVTHGIMPDLDFPDDTFDAVMFNLTLHHVENSPNPEGEYPKIYKTLQRAKQMLKQGGVIIFSSISACQVRNSYSWLMNDEYQNIAVKLLGIPPDTFKQYLKKIGMEKIEFVIPASATLWNKETHRDLDGPFKQEVRDSVSIFAHIANLGIMDRYLDDYQKLRDSIVSNEQFLDIDEKKRQDYGQIVFVHGCKL